MLLCGNPGEGIHAIRVMDVAVVDLAFVLGAAYFLSHTPQDFLKTTAVLLATGLIVHRLLGINTTLNKLVFGLV